MSFNTLDAHARAKPAPGSLVETGHPLMHRLYACYPFNENGGRKIYDIAGGVGVMTYTGSGSPQWYGYGARPAGEGFRAQTLVKSSFNPIVADCTLRIIVFPYSAYSTNFHTLLEAHVSGTRYHAHFTSGLQFNAVSLGASGADYTAPSLAIPLKEVSDLVFVRKYMRNGSNQQTRYVYRNGKKLITDVALTGTGFNTWPTTGIDWWIAKSSTGGSPLDADVLLVQFWSRGLNDGEVRDLYANPYEGICKGVSRLIVNNVVNATGTANAPASITLSSATLSAGSPDQAPTAEPPDIALTAPAATGIDSIDATGTAEPDDITLTAPTATAGEGQEPTAEPPDITLTAPTVITTNVGSAMPGTILLSAPTCRARPNYVYSPAPSYRGRFLRGGTLPITLTFTELPSSAPTARIFRGTTLVESVKIPVVDAARIVFGLDHFLGTDYLDGHYTILYLYDVDGNVQYSVEYFDVLGGTGRPPIVAVVEQKRPLGRAVMYFDDEGVARLGYSARVETP